ncbi:glutamate receptor 2.2 [Beta vulgaris subsp. vulgaris]|uniref:glutamate receptor 2.2 n=1 Tax=Beta vulgaris subsp. vulgaris TaxID=3555 RepID=UPI0020376454|nr:glutamate receptor 2.2 [Beta vulgaris subsp. vulgaris]
MKASMLKGLPMWLIFLFCALCCSVITKVAGQKTLENKTVAVNIGVIYEQGNNMRKMELNCIKLALSEFYKSNKQYNTRIVLNTRVYPKDSVAGATSAALYLLKYAEVKAIMGPIKSMEAEFIIQLGEEAQVPILSYSATSPFLSSVQSSYFIRTASNILPEAKAISALVHTFGWREIVPIYVDNNYGTGFIPYLTYALQQIGAHIPYHGVIPSFATHDQIREQLVKLKSMSTSVFVVHMSSDLASRLFLRANELEMMEEGFVWITTTGISNELGSLDSSVLESMQGVIGLKTYVPQTDNLRDFDSRWDKKFRDMKLSITGLWAYDAACALAKAVESVGNLNFGFQKKDMFANFTDLNTLGVSSVGRKLLLAMLNTSFSGLSGQFSLPDRQLNSSTYRIINVIGSGSRDIGFWTPKEKLVRSLNSSNHNLRAVIWPGETTLAPKGWVKLVGRKKLRVGVPFKPVYKELLNVTLDKTTRNLTVTGFCIHVFDTVMDKLGYSRLYEYHLIPGRDGRPSDSYDYSVHQVFLQNFDIVVGDITITANRSKYVDFTLPYTESGVTMVVPIRNERRNAWVFLKPLTWDLWVASLSAFIIIAFSIWVLEHRVNNEFRGPPSQQAGTSLFYSFSMLVFAQRENVLSNLSRFVVVIWVFVVFVLTQSYTASLTSMLTVQRLKPSITDVHELIIKEAYVGFQEGSFVQGLLIQKGFHESRLVSYNTSENLDDLLSKGNSNGGIAAVFDEIPYMKLFLAKYSTKYIMVQPLYKAEGFGFAFPKGSSLAPDVSREILDLVESDNMLAMEKAWGMPLYNVSDEGNKVAASSSLSLDNFWGLFMIAGVASGMSLLIYVATFLYEHKRIWLYSSASIRSKARDLAEAFLQRDMASHTFRNNEVQIARNVKIDESIHSVDNTDSPPRPSTLTDHTEEDLVLSAGTTPSSDHVSQPLASAATEEISHPSDYQNDHSI